ncbi:MAG: isoleucine--tRNA ligase [Phycisphaerales bacterium]|nr:isoleucine--tRNA ligase [Phycisphaerales bacterium]
MRANLSQNEPASTKRWDKQSLYASLMNARSDCDRFVFHDGPPFANGDIHVGHMLNKVLKDIVVRGQGMMGKLCPFVPGWDCHGLPIEHRVMTDLVASGKMEKLSSLDDDARRMAIRRECRKYAEKYQKVQSRQMRRLLTLADYEDPYLTMDPDYEASVLEVFADLVEAGLVYRQLKPVHWSIANETALAEAELEYQDRTDPSVWVDFTALDATAVGKAFGLELDERPAFMIWTTTPWTLPANMAIAVGGELSYVLVRFGGSLTVVAEGRLEALSEVCGVDDVEILGKCVGADLVGLTYEHPFCSRTGTLLQADHVTLEDGTGLVHTAPGHGTEDYIVGLAAGMDIYCPVLEDGTYDLSVPDWLQGLSVWDANEKVVEHLRQSGHLVHHVAYTHSYPHDWRSKTPVIFRSTEQWFVAVDADFGGGESLRNRGLTAIDQDVSFVPDWGRKRLRGMVESRPDWCLSRQRAWGLPIPAFFMPDGSMLLTASTVRAVAEVFEQEGSDAWFVKSPHELLTKWDAAADPEAPAGVDIDSLSKAYDIFDVWMESGSSWNAVMRRRNIGFPIDLYLEGSDQHRGWFQLSMLPALGVTGKSPYREVITHGFMVDRDGKKMSKSGDNALELEELLKDVGADVCRWWVSSLAFENDIRVDLELFQLAGESYRKVRNTLRYLLSNIDPETPDLNIEEVPGHTLDAWLLARCEELRVFVCESLKSYEFRKAHLALFDFCNDTLSSMYCVAMKDRLYCDPASSTRRVRSQAVMRHVAEQLCKLLAPILPHTADEAWRAMHGDEECVHLETISATPTVQVDPGWDRAMLLRDEALRALEQAKETGVEKSLDAGLILPEADQNLEAIGEDLKDLMEVSRLTFSGQHIRVEDLRSEPACERSWRRDGTVEERPNGSWLSDRDWEAVRGQDASE